MQREVNSWIVKLWNYENNNPISQNDFIIIIFITGRTVVHIINKLIYCTQYILFFYTV